MKSVMVLKTEISTTTVEEVSNFLVNNKTKTDALDKSLIILIIRICFWLKHKH